MLYTELPVPAETKPWKVEEINRLRAKLADPESVVAVDGVLRWLSNDRPVPPSAFKDAFCTFTPEQEAAHKTEMHAFLVEYRRAQADRSPEQIAEERMMARAAMGPGVDMVNVITGEKYST